MNNHTIFALLFFQMLQSFHHVRAGFKLHCSFEKDDDCIVLQESHHHIDWTIQHGETPTKETGPLGAQHGNFYLFFESSRQKKDDYGRVALPPVPSDSRYCVTFFYTMYGRTMGTFKVQRQGADGKMYDLWERNGDQGPEWVKDSLQVELNANDRIAFLGIRGHGYHSDIAVDNVDVVEC